MTNPNWREIYADNVGSGIKAFRSQSKYTQTRLCVELGICSRTITNWENGATEPEPYLFLALERIEPI